MSVKAIVAGVVLALSPLVAIGSSSIPAQASPTLPIHYKVQASTTLATLHQTVVVPPGTFNGSIDLGTGQLSGNLALPPATATVGLAGVGLATATFVVVPTAPVTGTVNFSTLAVTATASFNIRVPSVYPLGLPVNLVDPHCVTSAPVSVTFSGTFSLTGSSAFSGTYAIPSLERCGLLTPALDLLVAGPGNQFNATFSPGA